MNTRRVRLIDQDRMTLASAQVADDEGCFGGTVDLSSTPAPLRALFEEFEEIVDGQMFAFLDEIQGRIGASPVRAIFDDGGEFEVRDLQVYPTTGEISFRLADVASQAAKPAQVPDTTGVASSPGRR